MRVVQEVVQQVVVEVVLSGEIPSACGDGEAGSGKCISLSCSLQL